VSVVVEKASIRRRSRIPCVVVKKKLRPCVVVEKITTRRFEGVGVVAEKKQLRKSTSIQQKFL